MNVYELLTHLVDVGLFDPSDKELAEAFYRHVRVPILHGLTGRFVENCLEPAEGLEALGISGAEGWTFEETIEDQAISLVEGLISILERNTA